MMDSKTEEKGLIIVHTGAGKGKSSSGFGMIMRCIAHKIPCAVVQFIKGTWKTGERDFLEKKFSKECTFVVSGEGFTWETQDRARDIAAAKAGWEEAKKTQWKVQARSSLIPSGRQEGCTLPPAARALDLTTSE